MTVRTGRASRFIDRYRRLVAMSIYIAIAAFSYGLSFLIRFEFAIPDVYRTTILSSLALLLVIRLLAFSAFRISTGRWRFAGTGDVIRLLAAVFAGSVLFLVLTRVLSFDPVVPRSVILLEFMLTTYFTAGVWVAYRTAFQQLRIAASTNGGETKRVVLVGAGEAGAMLAREMRRFPTGYRPMGFVDDDELKWGTSVDGLNVVGGVAQLGRIAARLRADEIIIATPSASPEEMRRIVSACEGTSLPFKVLPGIAEVLRGDVRLNQLRDVQIEDLLGRDPIQLDLPELKGRLSGRTVLITGAAGSIGSELSRQVAEYKPETLVLFDQAETDLYFLDLDLREKHPDLHIVPIIGDVAETGSVERVFREYAPERVFHAAAYKHVPLMELNACEAIRNNVLGTWKVAEAAGRHGAESFVLVSTDKAVRPVSVMGATKRAAEVVILHLQTVHPHTAYGAVRFGNVLGSQGSVIPLFRRQLEAGKPLTVTHPEATRYFMTIPEAVQLILQASILPDLRGRVAMLEMGEPVRIVEMAQNLLRLSGIRCDHRSLVFTGLRPGERLHEELIAPDEETIPTPVPKVRLVLGTTASEPVARSVVRWEKSLLNGAAEADLLAEFSALFPDLQLLSEEPAPAPPPVLTGVKVRS